MISIQRKINLISKIDANLMMIANEHQSNKSLQSDLARLSLSLANLKAYLLSLERLEPNRTTNELPTYIEAISLDLDLLKNQLPKSDFKKLYNGFALIEKFLNYKPTKYSWIEYALLWLYEFIYFI